MKKILVITLLLLSWIVVQKATAQLRVGLNLNVGIQPQWGPDGLRPRFVLLYPRHRHIL